MVAHASNVSSVELGGQKTVSMREAAVTQTARTEGRPTLRSLGFIKVRVNQVHDQEVTQTEDG